MPRCTICNLEKEPDSFALDKRKKTGIRDECKECEDALRTGARPPPSVVESFVAVQEQPKLPALPEQRLDLAIELRMQFYQCSGLDALYDLAMMPLDKNSGLMQVKYLAAQRLAGPAAAAGDGPGGAKTAFDKTLSDLNELFHKKAPRLREIRERTATFDDGSSETSVIAGG